MLFENELDQQQNINGVMCEESQETWKLVPDVLRTLFRRAKA